GSRTRASRSPTWSPRYVSTVARPSRTMDPSVRCPVGHLSIAAPPHRAAPCSVNGWTPLSPDGHPASWVGQPERAPPTGPGSRSVDRQRGLLHVAEVLAVQVAADHPPGEIRQTGRPQPCIGVGQLGPWPPAVCGQGELLLLRVPRDVHLEGVHADAVEGLADDVDHLVG